jgi:nitrite reductase (NADH) small subunit
MSAMIGTDWIELGPIDAIPRLGARVVRRAEGDIAVFRLGDDRILALADRCPHRGGPLSQGIVHGDRVTCPLHNMVIGLCDGQAVAPDKGCTPVHPVEIRDGMIHLCLRPAAQSEETP